MKAEEKEASEGQSVYLVFKSASKEDPAGEYFALESTLIKEILSRPRLSHIPFLPRYVKGLLNLEGGPVCAVDFSLFRKLPATAGELSLVLNVGDLALKVDDVLDFRGQDEVKRERIDNSDEGLFKWRLTAGDMMSARVLETDRMLDIIREDVKGR